MLKMLSSIINKNKLSIEFVWLLLDGKLKGKQQGTQAQAQHSSVLLWCSKEASLIHLGININSECDMRKWFAFGKKIS